MSLYNSSVHLLYNDMWYSALYSEHTKSLSVNRQSVDSPIIENVMDRERIRLIEYVVGNTS